MRYSTYLYQGYQLKNYCELKKINYSTLYSKLYYLNQTQQYVSLNLDQKIELALKRYFHYEKFNKIREAFSLLENDNCHKTHKIVCKKLNINYSKLKRLSNANFDMKFLIIVTWYSYDLKDNTSIYISKKKIRRLLSSKDLEINDLVGLYKAGNKKIIEKIFEHQNKYLVLLVRKVVREYGFIINKDIFNELLSEANLIQLKAINRLVGNRANQIICYIVKCVRYQTLSYLKSNYSHQNYEYDDTRLKEKEVDLCIF